VGEHSAIPVGRPRCYVASPLGFTESGRWYYTHVYLPALKNVVDPVDPWSHAESVAGKLSADAVRAIGTRNAAAIRSSAVLAALLEGQELDAGTAAEIGFAAALGIPCCGLRTDLRQTGELGARVNLQVEAFIVASGGVIVHSLDDLVDALRDLVERLPSRTDAIVGGSASGSLKPAELRSRNSA
jgi:nucleoside 2-deoxyribosyltransferase